MSRAVLPLLWMILCLEACSPQQNLAAPGRDQMQEDMMAHPERYDPSSAFNRRVGLVAATPSIRRGGPAAPGYCPAGSLAASMAPSMTEGLEILRARCKPGDSLLLQRQNTGLIASACDLNKPVSPVGGDMLCTMGVLREIRQ